ncbi:PREDICTED: uncharacterized protein LOC108369977 [Rhagoletis zephyria]|uniref:uncharacterized protein LOC108369977 n=1 Tax=Rhagoletis zephyria TaxID=28612 RepID=UPI000811A471|nr:PREDICTED: uncharacterized protein LOC108369977 [Rhagoletis zephyria]
MDGEEMIFLDASILTGEARDNVSNNILNKSIYVDDTTTSKSFDSDISTLSSSRKRKHEDEINTDKLDEAIDKIVNISKPTVDAFSISQTLRAMPEETAYLTTKEIQDLLFQRKFSKVENSTEFEIRETGSPDTHGSNILYLAMPSVEIDPLINEDSFLY